MVGRRVWCWAGLVAIPLVGCQAHAPAPSEHRPGAPTRLSAYDEAAPGPRPLPGLLARVVCEDPRGDEPSWVDIEIDGTDEHAMRVCEDEMHGPRCPPDARRVERPCAREGLGPAPKVTRDASVLAQTIPAVDALTRVEAALEQRRETRGHVRVYRVFAGRDACEAAREDRTARERQEGERIRSAWLEEQRAHLERALQDGRAARKALEERAGGPVPERMASLRSQLGRASNEAQRQRVMSAMVETNALELEDEHLRRQEERDVKLLEAIRSARPYEPAVTFSCFAPRGRQ